MYFQHSPTSKYYSHIVFLIFRETMNDVFWSLLKDKTHAHTHMNYDIVAVLVHISTMVRFTGEKKIPIGNPLSRCPIPCIRLREQVTDTRYNYIQQNSLKRCSIKCMHLLF